MQDMGKEIHSHEWWLPYIEECRSLNISVSDYCKKKGFCYDAFYWHWRKENQCSQINEICEDQIYPVIVAGTVQNQDVKHIKINGINVSGSTDDLRDLLGIRL